MSLRGLAVAAGCSRTTPYRYFKNKADILAAVRQTQFQRIADQLEQQALSVSDPDDRLTALARCYIDFAMANPDAYRVMYSVNQQNEQGYPELLKQITRAQQPMISAVNDAIEKGSVHGDPINIAHVLWAGLHGIICLHLSDKLHMGRDIEELAEVMIRSLNRAVLCKPLTQAATRRVREGL